MAFLCCLAPTSRAADAIGWPGHIDGSWFWQLPQTPNGLQPYVSWHATGSTPAGDIYVRGMDHMTNAALYRFATGTDQFVYVGDARSASEVAANWKPGETAEKFHTRPTWHDGKVYVATMDYSKIDAGYLERRGFHWYVYDPIISAFTDLSATEPRGVGAPQLGIVTIASDPSRNVLYGAAVPTGQLFRHDVGTNSTTDLGRVTTTATTCTWGGSCGSTNRGRVYFSAGNSQGYGAPYDPAIYGHMRYYEPGAGFGELKDWTLGSAVDAGQCTADRKTCWLADDHSHVYRFEDEGPTWTYLGQIIPVSDSKRSWLFQVSPDGRFAYALGKARPSSLDLPSFTSSTWQRGTLASSAASTN